MTFLHFSRFFLYAATLAVTVVLTSTFFPFIGGKYYFFRFTVELALLFLVFYWGFEDGAGEIKAKLQRLFREPLFLAVSVFAFMFLLSSLAAYDPDAAFWSNFERGEGAFQMLHYYAYFVLLLLLLDKREYWETLFRVSLVAAVILILYGVAAAAFIGNFVGQYRDAAGQPLEPGFWGRLFTPDSRFQGSLGNPAYVAPYLIFSMFYAAWLWFSGKIDLRRNLTYGALIALFLLFFALTQTRGAFIGLVAAAVVFLAYLILTTRPETRKVAAIAFLALAVVGGTLWVYRENPLVQKIPGARFLTISISEASAQTRIWTWRTAWEGFKERPLLGWGPENFSTVFDRHFDIRHFVPGKNTETWFDRAHSVIFDYLAETGILGLGSYLTMFGVFYWQWWENFGRRREHDNRTPAQGSLFGIHESALLRGLLLAIPVAYLVQGIILFDVLPIFINVMIVLAFGARIFHERHIHAHA